MTTAQLNAVSLALKEHTEGVAKINRRLSQRMKSIPGATEALRRYLATQGMNSEQIAQILAFDVPASALPALLNVAPRKN